MSTVWNISKHLPEALQGEFRRLVGEYLLKVYRFHEKKKQEELTAEQTMVEDIIMALEDSPAKPKTGEGQQTSSATDQIKGLMDDVEDYRKDFDHEFICDLIANHFSSKLFN